METPNSYQWWAALGAGLIAGLILLIVPRGNPWAGVTFFAPVVMGRDLAPSQTVSLSESSLMHLGLTVVYGAIISVSVQRVTQFRAFLTGGLVGLALYGLNLGVVLLWLPMLRGNEIAVAVTHLVFGMIAAGAYRGLLRRRSLQSS